MAANTPSDASAYCRVPANRFPKRNIFLPAMCRRSPCLSSGDEPIVLSKVSEEPNEHAGNVWVKISVLLVGAEFSRYRNFSNLKSAAGSAAWLESRRFSSSAPESDVAAWLDGLGL